MLIVLARADDQPARRYVFPDGAVSLCRGAGLDIRVTELNRHAQVAMVSVRDRHIELHVFDDSVGVQVNHRPVARSRRVSASDEVRVLDTRLTFATGPHPIEVDRAPFVARDATEAALIAEVAAGDATARAVYTDWLEQRGESVRADFLRRQDALNRLGPSAPGFAEASAQLAACASQIPAGWRARVATARIEACELAYDFRCPKQWDQLDETADPSVRHCGACRRDVHYALSVGEARRHASLGRCVALDATSARWSDDLAPPFGEATCEACRADLERGNSVSCDHCGFSPPRRMATVGALVFDP